MFLNVNLNNRKSISPLIAVILLVVVTVVLVTVILQWGKDFTQDNLKLTNDLIEDKSLDGLIISEKAIESDNSSFIRLQNTTKDKSIIITSYKILDDDCDGYMIGEVIDFNEPIILNSNNSVNLPIYYFPSQSFNLQLITNNRKYIDVFINVDKITGNNCIKKSDILLEQDYENGNSLDLSDNNNDGFDTNVIYDSFGVNFINNTSQISIENNSSLYLDNSDFLIDFIISGDFFGNVITKARSAGTLGLGIFVDDKGYINANFFGDDDIYSFEGIGVDDSYIYTSSKVGCITKIDKHTFEIVKNKCDYDSDLSYGEYIRPQRQTNMVIYGDYLIFAENRNRIVKLNKNTLEYVDHLGGISSGSGDDQFNYPIGVSIYDDIVYVVDRNNKRIKLHSADNLSYITAINLIDYNSDFSSVYGVFVNDNGIYVSLTNYIALFNSYPDLSLKKVITSVGSENINHVGSDYFLARDSICSDGDFIYTGSSDTDVAALFKLDKDLNSVVLSKGTWGYSNDNFLRTRGLALSDGILYIVDGFHRIVAKRTSDFSYIRQIGSFPDFGTPKNFFDQARKLHVNNDYIYLADTSNNRVVKLDANSQEIVATSDTNISLAEDVTVDSSGYVYVLSMGLDKVFKLDSNLNFVKAVGGTGYGDYLYNMFYDVEITTDNIYLYFTDNKNKRIVKLRNSDLNFIDDVGGPQDNTFSSPKAITYKDGLLYIIDSNVEVYSADTLAFIREYIGSGTSICVKDNYFVVGTRFNTLQKRSLVDYSIIEEFSEGGINDGYFFDGRIGDLTGISCTDNAVYLAGWYMGNIQKRKIEDFSILSKLGQMYLAEIKSVNPITKDSYVSIIRENNSFCILINGVLDNCKTFDPWPLNLSFDNSYPFLIGNMRYSISTNNGNIKYLSILKHPMTPSRAKGIYNYKKYKLD